MKRYIPTIIVAASMLAGCQTPGTPGPALIISADNCQRVVDGANAAGEIVALLGSIGIAPAKAEALARLIRLGSMGTAGLCAILFPPVKPLPTHPDPLPPPPQG